MENVCQIKEDKTINNFLKENSEMIFNVSYLVEEIKNNIFGSDGLKGEESPNPTCMMHVLDIQNYNLRKTLDDLNLIIKTLRPNN